MPETESSAQRIRKERAEHRRKLLLWLIPSLILISTCVAVILRFVPTALQPKVMASAGLLVDIAGAALVAIPILRPYREPVKDGMQFLSYYEPWRTQAVAEHERRLTIPMEIGAAFLLIGFVLQLVSQWL